MNENLKISDLSPGQRNLTDIEQREERERERSELKRVNETPKRKKIRKKLPRM